MVGEHKRERGLRLLNFFPMQNLVASDKLQCRRFPCPASLASHRLCTKAFEKWNEKWWHCAPAEPPTFSPQAASFGPYVVATVQ